MYVYFALETHYKALINIVIKISENYIIWQHRSKTISTKNQITSKKLSQTDKHQYKIDTEHQNNSVHGL